VSTLKTKSALSYFGSDSEVAKELASMLDDCKHVTIPFCGGMSILPHLKARAIVANDLNELAINFYRHASGVMGEECQGLLIERCQHTLSHPSEMEDAESRTLHPAWHGSWQQAWAYWAQCWIGRKGKGGTKHPAGMPSVRRTASGGTNASRIRAAADDLLEWAKQFERCEWESVDFRELIPKVTDVAANGIYADAPWVGAGRNYLHNFTDEDHSELEFLLRRFDSATVVVRYGDCATVRDLYSHPRWRIVEAESRDQCNVVKGEVWITNQLGD
jgi:site-specific DNA-adenine methylase